VANKLAFAYVAKDTAGKEVRGNIEAETKEAAQAELRGRRLTVQKVEVQVKRKAGISRRSASPKELSMFTRQLATMIGAGIPLLESFEILSQQAMSTNKGFGMGLQEAADLVRGGTEMSEAMHAFPGIFPDIYINMVKAGEASGQLDIILNRLADFLEAAEALKSEIKSAMTYPVISLVMISGITIYLLVGVVPKFEQMFNQLGGKLPALTQIVVNASNFMQERWYVMAGIAIAIVVAYKIAVKSKEGRRVRDLVLLKMPVFGPLSQKVALSRFARTFATLLASGVPLLAALEIVASTAGNVIIEDTLLLTRDTVRKGENLTTGLQTSWVFPPMVVKMMSIGERSGALEQLLMKIADFYDQQIHATVKALTSLIEPFMLMIMGAIVGTIVAAIFLPILELQKQLM
jgi:type IV pilus assembly protein PilC